MPGPNAECPACGAPVDDAWCPECGLELGGTEADVLRDLTSQLAVAEAELNAAWVRRDELAQQLSSRRWERVNVASGPSWSPPRREAAPRPAAEWDLERVRNVLLWTGATLLALSALTFTAVAWTHLGPGGRAVLLLVVTVLAGVGAVATRDRLPATSGALTGLAIALALVDWQIARRAGAAPGLSTSAWWAIGTAVVAAASIAFGRIAAVAPARRAVTVLVPTSAVLALATAASAAWAVALGLSLLAAALIAVDRATAARHGDAVVHMVVRVEAATAWIAASFAVLVAAFEPQSFAATLAPAAVMTTLALAPGIVFARPVPETLDRVPWAVLVILPCLGAALTLPSTMVGPVGLLTIAVVLGCIGLAIAPLLVVVWQRATRWIGAAIGVVGLCVAGSAALVAVFGPLAWLGAAWSGALTAGARDVVAGPNTNAVPLLGWSAVAILGAIGVTIPLATRGPAAGRPADAFLWRVTAAVVFLLASAIVPIASGAPAYVAWAAAVVEVAALVGGPAWASRAHADRAPVLALLVLVPVIPAVGWAAMTPAASIAALAVLVCAAGAAVAVGRVEVLRAAHASLGATAAMLLAGTVATAAGAFVPIAAFAASVVAGIVLLLGTHRRRGTADGVALELTGVVGGVVAAALALPSTAWLAATLTIGVPFLVVAGLAHRRVEYGALALAAALGATWSWLAVADVRVVEAYTLPAALAALVAGTRARRDARARSWLTLGPALVLSLGPTLLLAIARHDDGRAIAVACAAVVVLLAGAHRRLQAPIVLGSATLLALGVDKLGPPAARLPRWTILALAGSLLLWVGTTFERRRADVQRAVRGFERLG